MMKKVKTIAIISVIIFFVTFVFICITFSVIIPAYLEKKFLPQLAKESGIEGFSLRIRKIGFSGADFGSIQFGEKPLKPLSISSIRINYSLSGLLKRHLKSIHVCGLSLAFEIKDGKVLFPGIELNEFISGNDSSGEKASREKPSFPLSFDRIVIEHAVVTAKKDGNILRIPFDLTILPQNEDFNILNCEINFFSFEKPVNAEIRIDLDSGALKIFCDAQNLRLENYFSYLPSEQNFHVKGNLDIKGYAEINPDDLESSVVNILMKSKAFQVLSENLKLEKSKENDEAFIINIQGEGLSEWKISASGLTLVSPVMIEIPEIRADLSALPDGLECQFQMDTILKGIDFQKLDIMPDFHRHWTGFVKYANNGDWFAELEIMSREDFSDKQTSGWYRITGLEADVGFYVPSVIISGHGNLENGHARGDLKISGIYVDTHAVSLEFPAVLLNAEIFQDIQDEKEKTQQLHFEALMKNTAVRLGATHAKFPEISLTGHNGLSGQENDIHSTLKIKGGELSDSMVDAKIQGISLELPLVWPASTKVREGNFKIDTLRFKEKNLGKMKASIRQSGQGGEIRGEFESRLFPGLILSLDGKISDTGSGMETRMNFEIPEYQFPNGFNLGDFFPDAEGVFMDGKVGVKADFYKLGPKMTSSAQIHTRDMNIFMERPQLEVKNIRCDFTLADLFELRSLPHQNIRFDSAKIGNIEINSGSVDFQMQSADRFFIEKTTFKWCGGNVDTNAAAISFPIENLGLTFYCDRLKLTQVLEQLGGIRGDGEVTVNGRIPFRYDDGKITFDKGFLYSTPGDGGTIRLTDTDGLMMGIPEGTPQFSQIDLAREALKNYQYDWARLDINTELEILNLELKLDGKPLEVLPFEYRQDFGGFVRVDADSPGSRFQGIRLDVNFNLPLDRVLIYGKGLKDIFNIGN